MPIEKKYPTINGNKYYVKIVETHRKKRVTVYNADDNVNYYIRGSGKNYIVNNKKWRGWLLWFGADPTPSLEEMIQTTLNEAVCIRENKEEEMEQFESRIDSTITDVKEVHNGKQNI